MGISGRLVVVLVLSLTALAILMGRAGVNKMERIPSEEQGLSLHVGPVDSPSVWVMRTWLSQRGWWAIWTCFTALGGLSMVLLFRHERLVAALLILVATVGLLAVPGFWIWLEAFMNWPH
jgi:hypothetical protein